ncbi:hypothetical protein SASPL_122455 [Salvia splendens]|uniref:Glucan endo-1,3-beta-D-glucosidase n=1 Tax=Salvia splendens TaxID=180675 RepID=A0A8X8XNC7_SALSN|nr:hypothetical protein SASPL_122455 [Salvia splendens]
MLIILLFVVLSPRHQPAARWLTTSPHRPKSPHSSVTKLLAFLMNQMRSLILKNEESIVSDPPSSGRFRRVYDRVIFTPILEFHRRTKSPFMICPYPYFGFTAGTGDYALFRQNDGVLDGGTGLKYTNTSMFAAQLDAVYPAMKRVGYGDVDQMGVGGGQCGVVQR